MRPILKSAKKIGALLTATIALSTTGATQVSDYKKYFNAYKRPKAIPYPDANKYTKAKEELGRTLFFDPRLSGSNFISCATCHNPGFSWADGLPKGIGHGMQELGRRSPTLLNLAWGSAMFWDGRADGLEEQALGPIKSEKEMNLPLADLEKKINSIAGYAPLFKKAFPGEAIAANTIAKAIATFERTIVSASAPFDKWIAGDEKAVSNEAKRGFILFNEKAQCAVCHSGWRFTDDGFHDIGIPGTDKGRGEILKDIDSVKFAFKTPTLRNVDHRSPYMHDGSEKTLEDVIHLYIIGGKEKRPTLSDNIKPLAITPSEKDDLLAFLHTLTSQIKEVAAPMMPR